MARDRIARILLDATRSGTKTRRARALEKTRIEKNRPTDRPTDRPTVSWNQSWLTPREVTR
jgi:hypothetical protein